MKLLDVIIALLFGALFCVAGDEAIKPYNVILNNHLFGKIPTNPQPISIDQSFAKNMRLSMLYKGPDGEIRVGLVDSQAGKSYVLSVGELKDGLELIKADISSHEAVVKKGFEVVKFKLKGATKTMATTDEPQVVANKPSAPKTISKDQESTQRTSANKEEPEGKQAPTGNAFRKHIEELQMEAIRKGEPHSPIQLTPEMDAQLVKEGVLAPQ